MPIREVLLNPGETKTWEINEVGKLRRLDIISAGLEFNYSTQSGSVMVSALSVSSSGNQVFKVPLLDPSTQTSSTGVYPFYLDYGSSTVVYIKNTTDHEQKYIAHLVYEDSRYRIGVKKIAAGETIAIDIRSLRDSQIPDEEGEVIPANLARGQLRWTRIEEEEIISPAMIGRAEQIYEGRAMSSTYACQSCCGDMPVRRSISPSLSGVQVGQTVQMRAFEIRSDCNGWEYQLERSASWNSSNEQVATVSDNRITFVGVGETTIKASWNSSVPFSTQCVENPGFVPGPEPIGPIVCCNNRPLPLSESTQARARSRVDRTDPPRALIGICQIDVNIIGEGFGSAPSRVVVTVGGTGISAQIDQVTPREILAGFTIGSNASPGDHTVTVTVNGVASNSVNFFVQVPTRLRRDSISGLINQQGGCGATRALTYTLLDQSQAGQPIRTDGSLLGFPSKPSSYKAARTSRKKHE